MTFWRTARAASGEQPQLGPHHDAKSDNRAVIEWLKENPPRGPTAQLMTDVLTLIVWITLGLLTVVSFGGSLLVLTFLMLLG